MAAHVENQLLSQYRRDRDPGAYDEMFTDAREVREHWAYFARALEALGPAELDSRCREVARLLREGGVTYNVYNDPKGYQRLWALDPIPLLISSDEWAGIETGLVQRAELLNLVLRDLYGPRELIRQGIVPPELIYTHDGFLRPCDQVALPGEHQLVVYAADLARGPHGQMWVMSDRAQAPSGAGYALANRMVMSRVFPSLFRDSQVHRLALFYQALRSGLASLSPRQETTPRVVILTPGPYNETYFEHAHLAGYLGYTLVQGGDLRVQDGRVWLRSLNRLEPVDVILRRVDGSFCDPLELRPDSMLGVPGLLEAMRRGNVAIVNPPGSSVLENPGLMAYLPAIAEHFLGQPLKLPTVATWWCGQPRERGYVLANLNRLVIKTTSRSDGTPPVFGALASEAELADLRARIEARPHHYVGQEALNLSAVPTVVDSGLLPRRAVLRSYLVARDDGYAVMPGGLTRTALNSDPAVISNQATAISKDTWVLASEPEKQFSLLPHQAPKVAVAVLRGPLPGGAADLLFWFGRYSERAEESTRLLRTVLAWRSDVVEFRNDTDVQCLHCLLRALTRLTGTFPGFLGEGADDRLEEPDAELRSVILDGAREGSLVANLRRLERDAHGVRDRLSSDMLRVLSQVSAKRNVLEKFGEGDQVLLRDELDDLVTLLVALSGLSVESMIRGQDWLFLDIGRRLERAALVSELVAATLVPASHEAVERLLLESVLRAAESLTSYRRDYGSFPRLETVLDLMLLDGSNPRGLRYQLARLQEHVSVLPKDGQDSRLSDEERLVVDAVTALRLADTATLSRADEPSMRRLELEQLLSRVTGALRQLSDSLGARYFTDVVGPQQLIPAPPGRGQ